MTEYNRETVQRESPVLPVREHASEIKETFRGNDEVIIISDTGSGKTTQLPLFFWEMGVEGRILVTQPRRIAATSVCRYVSGEVGCQVGQEVGYQIRFDDQTSEGTKINFVTDGILLRHLQTDPLLRDFSTVMVDEAHERNLNTDFLLGLLKIAQSKRKESGLPPLKIVVSSATLEKEKFRAFFDGAPVVEIPGRLYPVETQYLSEAEKARYGKEGFWDEKKFEYIRACADKVIERIKAGENDHDFLVFMPGKAEIDEVKKLIETQLQSLGMAEKFQLLPLHGEMSDEDQNKIFDPNSPRKIIVATNIAETSITPIRPVDVIDSGLIKQIQFDPRTGITALVLVPHSQKGLEQRAGRAGRLAPGRYDGVFTEADLYDRDEYQEPEIKRTDIAQVVLQMKVMGIKDVYHFPFVDQPEKAAFERAISTLKSLGALNSEEKITEMGKLMTELPIEPRKARMVIEAEKNHCVEEICTLAALLSCRKPVFYRQEDKKYEADEAHRKFKDSSDFLTLLKVWDEYLKVYAQAESARARKDPRAGEILRKWGQDNFINTNTLSEARQIRYQLMRVLGKNGYRAESNRDPEAIGKSIAAGYADHLISQGARYSYRRIDEIETAYAGGIFIHPSSVYFSSPRDLFVAAELVTTEGKKGPKTYGRYLQEVRPEWLPEIAPQLIEEEPGDVHYDEFQDRVIKEIRLFLKGNRDISFSVEREITGSEAVSAFAHWLAEVSHLPEGAEFLWPILRSNSEMMLQLRELWIRAGGKIDYV